MNASYSRALLSALALLSIQACKHPLAIQGQGDIIEQLGGMRGCTLEESQAGDPRCTENSAVGESYEVSYKAVPRAGWQFARWEGTPCTTHPAPDVCAYPFAQNVVDIVNEILPGFAYPPTVAVFEPAPPPRPINDTGVTWGGNYPSGNNNRSACIGETIEEQDCSRGRDVSQNDPADGHAGFSFTKLDQEGKELPADAESWACVRDNFTELVWEVKTDDGGIHDKDNIYRWGGKTAILSGAEAYDSWDPLVDGSNAEALCGFTDWRVPRVDELVGIVHYDRFQGALDPAWFPNGYDFPLVRIFWSASPLPTSLPLGLAWWVNFDSGDASDSRRTNHSSVRLVRGDYFQSPGFAHCESGVPPTTPDEQLLDNGDGTVTDTATNLMWKQCPEGTELPDCLGFGDVFTWQEALQHPGVVNAGGGFAGHTDWRLPNIKELYSIVELACQAPAANINRFPPNAVSAFSGEFLSATPDASNTSLVWVISFNDGDIFTTTRSTPNLVRLVRDL